MPAVAFLTSVALARAGGVVYIGDINILMARMEWIIIKNYYLYILYLLNFSEVIRYSGCTSKVV